MDFTKPMHVVRKGYNNLYNNNFEMIIMLYY